MALLGAAWLVPLMLHELRLDVIQPVLLVVAVASVLRAGTNIVDRLVLAACLLAGVVLSLGLVFSIWPWRLHPVPVGGVLFSLVVAAGRLARRRPSLPRRLLGSDLVVVGSGLFAFVAAYVPAARLPAARRFYLSAIKTDRYNHFALFDTIHRLGGYAFLHQSQSRFFVQSPTQVVYPAGAHFLYALFDTFLRSTTDPGATLAEFNRYFVDVLVGYGILVMVVVWAARWTAGPRMAGWRSVVICAAVAGLMISGPFVILVANTLDSEVIGLAFLALAVAVLVRPPAVVGEQVLIACALLIGVAYAYNLFAVFVLAAMACSVIVYRRRLGRHWRFAVVVFVVASAIAFYPTALSLTSGFNAQALSLARGFTVPLPLRAPLLPALVIAAAMARRTARRSPGWQMMIVLLVCSAAIIAVFAVYQLSQIGRTSYYYNKILMGGYVVCLAGSGVAGALLPRFRAWSRPAGRLRPFAKIPLAIAAGAVALTIAAGFQASSGLARWSPPAWAKTALGRWNDGKITAFSGASLMALADAHLLGSGVPTLVLTSSRITNWYDTYLAAALNRDLGVMQAPLEAMLSKGVNLAHGDQVSTVRLSAEVQAALDGDRFRVRLVAGDQAIAAKLRAILAAHPRLNATVLTLPARRFP